MVLSAPFALDTPSTRNPIIATTIFAVVATVTTIFRLLSRRVRGLPLEADDYLIPIALFFTYVEYGLQIACVIAGGTGRHIADINPLDAVKTLKLILPFEALYGIILMFVKLSMLHLYLRLFGQNKKFTQACYVVGAIIVMWMISIVLETFLLCRPLALNWDVTVKGTCGDRNTVFVSAGVLNLIIDFMLMGLPIPVIWNLQMPTARKMGLAIIFCLGIFITVISIIRIKSLQAISFTDPTWTLPMGLMWTVIEPELTIINANLPVIQPFFAAILPKIFGSTIKQTGNTDPNRFNRLDEGTFPLTDIENGSGIGNSRSVNKSITGSRGKSLDGDSDTRSDPNEFRAHGITVTSEWDVQR